VQTENQIFSKPPFIFPPTPTVLNYIYTYNIGALIAQELSGGGSALGGFFIPGSAQWFMRGIVNSVVVAVTVMAYNVFAGTLAAFALARMRFRGDTAFFFGAISGRMIPPVVIAIPYYIIIRNLGLLDNLISLVLVYIVFTLPFTIWILSTYFGTIPTDIEDAARIYGYTYFETLRKVTFPLIRPAIVVIAIYSFLLSYTEFFFALLLTTSQNAETVPVIIANSLAIPNAIKGLPAAMGIVAMIAPLIMIIIFRRYLIKGLVAGAVK
jgi:multiple sugar transport system permease protein